MERKASQQSKRPISRTKLRSRVPDVERERAIVLALADACGSPKPTVILALLLDEAEAIYRARAKSEGWEWPGSEALLIEMRDARTFLDLAEPDGSTLPANDRQVTAAEAWAALSQEIPLLRTPPRQGRPELRIARAAIRLALALAPYAKRGRPIKNDLKRRKLREAVSQFRVEKPGKFAGYMTLESSLRDKWIEKRVEERDRDRPKKKQTGPIRDDFLALFDHLRQNGNLNDGATFETYSKENVGYIDVTSTMRGDVASDLAESFHDRRKMGLRHPNPLIGHAVVGALEARLTRILIRIP